MPRGYRCILIAVVGWLSLAAAQSNVAADKEEGATQERVANSLENIASTYREQTERAERSPETRPCEPGYDQRDSDLCAQWKAADAANRAALFGGISIIGIAIAIGLTLQSNNIARDTAKHQLRAYVSMREIGRRPEPKEGAITHWVFQFEWTNSGQTPATDTNLMAGHAIGPGPLPADLNYVPDDEGVATKSVIGPTLSLYSITQIPVEDLVKAIAKGHGVYVYSAADYRDMFDQPRRTEFCQQIIPEGDPRHRSCDWRNLNTGPFNGMDGGCRYPPKQG